MRSWYVAVGLGAGLLAARTTHGQAPSASVSASSKGSASASSAASVAPSAASVAPSAAPSAQPAPPPNHGHGGSEEGPKIPKDVAMDDSSLPAGVVRARILDEAEKPVVGVVVTLAILKTKVSEGELKTTKTATTDAAGWVEFRELTKGSEFAYRVSISNTAPDAPAYVATYGSPPFNLALDRGFHIEIHRFPVSASLEKLLVAVEGADTIMEIRDDQLEVQQVFDVLNVDTTTWALGPGLVLTLPPGTRGLRAPEGMEDHSAIPEEGVGVRWKGAYPPGRTRLAYDYKIPFDGSGDIDIEIALPPRVMVARVRVPTRRGMTLTVDGFPPAKDEMTEVGVKVATVLKQGSPQEPIHKLRIRVQGIPTVGSARNAAVGGAIALAALGLVLSSRGSKRAANAKNLASARDKLRQQCLNELREIREAKESGALGPKAYDRERNRLIDQIARTMEA